MVWVGRDFNTHLVPGLCHGQGTLHYPRLFSGNKMCSSSMGTCEGTSSYPSLLSINGKLKLPFPGCFVG